MNPDVPDKKGMNVCFVANFWKTYFFHEIALQLKKNGIKVCWIVPKESQVGYLSEHYAPEMILGISRKYTQREEYPVNDYKINELIFGDRVLRNELRAGQKFLINIQRPIYNFIVRNKIQLIFGEVTWAHELLIHRMVTVQKELNCKYYSMHTIRIPNGRFAFFEDEKQTRLVEREGTSSVNAGYVLPVEKPAYAKQNDTILKDKMSLSGRLSRLNRFVTGRYFEKTDPNTNVAGVHRWWLPVREELNREFYKLVKRRSINDIVGKPYILFGLHKQPEASIDVCGRYFENQFENIINLWRQLSTDWRLVVKEHSNAIGDRSLWFYRKLDRYPGIVLADETIDSLLLIRNSRLVATNTGTLALEAALLGIPSITFSPVFFNRLNYCKHVDWSMLERYRNIQVLIDEISKENPNMEEYAGYIMDNTFEGSIGDTLSNPSVMESDNVRKVADAVLSLTSKRNSQIQLKNDNPTYSLNWADLERTAGATEPVP